MYSAGFAAASRHTDIVIGAAAPRSCFLTRK
jgi:hypothetical protein